MQVAKLMDPSLKRRNPIIVKIQQMLAALRLEHHWSKEEILEAVLPWLLTAGILKVFMRRLKLGFRKRQSVSRSTRPLLVALPQSPEARRPDRHPERAFKAKQMVLFRVKDRIDFDYELVSEVASEPALTIGET